MWTSIVKFITELPALITKIMDAWQTYKKKKSVVSIQQARDARDKAYAMPNKTPEEKKAREKAIQESLELWSRATGGGV